MGSISTWKLGGKTRTECPNTNFSLPTLLYAEYRYKLKTNILNKNAKTKIEPKIKDRLVHKLTNDFI